MNIHFVKNENKYKYCSINSTNRKVINMKSWKSILHEINTIYILNVNKVFVQSKMPISKRYFAWQFVITHPVKRIEQTIARYLWADIRIFKIKLRIKR